MPWTDQQRREYQARYRREHPHYRRELMSYRKQMEGKWRAEFETKTKKTRPVKSSPWSDRQAYPWESD